VHFELRLYAPVLVGQCAAVEDVDGTRSCSRPRSESNSLTL
jgi:hypothetical protein